MEYWLPMKTISVQLNTETAKRVLADFENQISEKIQARDKLNSEIAELDEGAKAMREQLDGASGTGTRSPRGENLKRIRKYLKELPENKGAKMSQISKSTGVGVSSASFTLRNYKKLFVQDENGLWKLK
jgi:septal ring factor EnvC (AmiA/AmiB activator)